MGKGINKALGLGKNSKFQGPMLIHELLRTAVVHGLFQTIEYRSKYLANLNS